MSSPSRLVVVAGASGHLGRSIARSLAARGWAVRGVGRRPRAADSLATEWIQADLGAPGADLDQICRGAEALVSTVGASLDLKGPGRPSYRDVDGPVNARLFRAARDAGIERVAYVSLHAADRLLGTEYARAHEEAVRALRETVARPLVVRPTGVFWVFTEILEMARKGMVPVIGDGSARTNPVHEDDVAEAVAAAPERDADEVCVGGPEVLTRRQVAELALAARGKSSRVVRVPAAVFRGVAAAARPFSPRVSALLAFGTEVSLVDVVAPATGVRRLSDYFRERLAAAS